MSEPDHPPTATPDRSDKPQRCPICNSALRLSRDGEHYRCPYCGFRPDAPALKHIAFGPGFVPW
jgi:DNA-directed RNA polymerase subunit RPC12/RpoP